MELAALLWTSLGWPLLKLILFVSIGLLVANIIESLNWTHRVASISAPLIRLGNLSDICGASFSMAFFSGVSANTMLAEAYDQGRMSKKELILANLFNSLPTYFLHLPTMFFITIPLIKSLAFVYVGLTFFAAFLRTVFVLIMSRLLLTARRDEVCISCETGEDRTQGFREAAKKAWDRFLKRIKNILLITVPIYICFFYFSRSGVFDQMERFIANHVSFLSWLHPESIGIVVFHIAAEFTAGIAAAGALVGSGVIENKEIVMALLVGNVLSSPVRAIRHQFPYYAGIFTPKLAFEMIIYNQLFRVGSLVLVALLYFYLLA